MGSIPGSGTSSEKEMEIHSSILPGKSPEKRILVGYSPWGRKELGMTETKHHTTCVVFKEVES